MATGPLTAKMARRSASQGRSLSLCNVKTHFCHALALYFVYYNFVRRHQTLRVSPAMAAGVSRRLWSMEDIVALIDQAEGEPKKRGPYKARQPQSAAAISN